MARIDRVEARVAKILNDRELVINRGSLAGVEVGMRFAVLADEGFDVEDPETGELLGDVERPKTIVKVTQVKEKLAIASTYRKKTTGSAGVLGPTASVLAQFTDNRREVTETLRSDDYAPAPSEEESIVQINDRIVQVIGEEFAGWSW